ncbi:hypothetical protein BDR06DRAFT_976363 [Suillus hirtellus]|nr:hypothetical protein BDR06DRAFT_976363 [Suillus hirtellus]
MQAHGHDISYMFIVAQIWYCDKPQNAEYRNEMKWSIKILGQGLAQTTPEAKRTRKRLRLKPGSIAQACVASRQPVRGNNPFGWAAMVGPGDNRIPPENIYLPMTSERMCDRRKAPPPKEGKTLRTQYTVLLAVDHRVRVLHDLVGRVTRCLDNV